MHICKCLILFLFTSLNSYGQFKNIKLDEATSTNSVCEPAITINRKNPNNIIAASITDNIYVTVDGGVTWQTSKLTSPLGVYLNPVLVSDDKGDIYSFHLSDPSGEGSKNEKSLDQIICHLSKDGGKTWQEEGSIGLNAPKDQDKPWATVDSKGNIWVAWTQFDKYNSDDPNCQSTILLSSSSNGKKWSKPFQISQTPGNCADSDDTAGGAVPAIGVDGKAFVAWANQSKIFLDRSFDGGGLWLTNDIAITKQAGGWDMNIPGHDRCNGMPVLMIDQSKSIYRGSLYITWADQRTGDKDADVWFMRSTNYGDNWTTPIKLGEDKNGRHQYLPWTTVDQTTGYIYIVYYDRSNYEDNQTDVYLSYSINGGSSFKNVQISEAPFTPDSTALFGDYINIAAHKGIITPIWTRMDEGKTSVWTAIIKQADLIAAPETSKKKKKK